MPKHPKIIFAVLFVLFISLDNFLDCGCKSLSLPSWKCHHLDVAYTVNNSLLLIQWYTWPHILPTWYGLLCNGRPWSETSPPSRIFFIRTVKYMSFGIFYPPLEGSWDVSPPIYIPIDMLLFFPRTSAGPVVSVDSCSRPAFHFHHNLLCGKHISAYILSIYCWFNWILGLLTSYFYHFCHKLQWWWEDLFNPN